VEVGRNESPWRSLLYLALFGLPALSLAWLGPFYLFCFRATGVLGHTPADKPDLLAAARALPGLDNTVRSWLLLALLSAFPWLAVGLLALARRWVSERLAVGAALLWLPFSAVCVIDPGGWLRWYFG
jgi:hypothetical protein